MTPVQYTEEEAYDAADLSLGLKKGMPEVTLCWRHLKKVDMFFFWESIIGGFLKIAKFVNENKTHLSALSHTRTKKPHHALFDFTATFL